MRAGLEIRIGQLVHCTVLVLVLIVIMIFFVLNLVVFVFMFVMHSQHSVIGDLIALEILILKAVGNVESTYATSCRNVPGFAVINGLRLTSEESAKTLEISHGDRVINHVDDAAK